MGARTITELRNVRPSPLVPRSAPNVTWALTLSDDGQLQATARAVRDHVSVFWPFVPQAAG